MDKKIAVVCLSGGMDSTSLMLRFLAQGFEVRPVSFRYGQKHVIEIERAQKNVNYLQLRGTNCDSQRLIDLSNTMSVFKSALTSQGVEVPEGHYEQDNMKATVVPNRNMIFTSIVSGLALSIALEENSSVILGLGTHAGDHAVYPDCRPEFFSALQTAFHLGNWDSGKVMWDLPYLDVTKVEILRDALHSCDVLGLDFDTIFRNTNTSYNPDGQGRSSGKSGADVERILAFHTIGRKDPVEYAGGWEAALENAIRVRDEWENKT